MAMQIILSLKNVTLFTGRSKCILQVTESNYSLAEDKNYNNGTAQVNVNAEYERTGSNPWAQSPISVMAKKQ